MLYCQVHQCTGCFCFVLNILPSGKCGLYKQLKPNTFANFEVPAKIAHRNFFFAISGIVNQFFFNN
jgi:hypothetical protein